MIPRTEQKNPWLTNTCKGQWLGTAKSQDQGTDRRLVGMSDSSMQTVIIIIIVIIFKGRLVPEPPSMACDFCAAIIPPGTGPGAPSQ